MKAVRCSNTSEAPHMLSEHSAHHCQHQTTDHTQEHRHLANADVPHIEVGVSMAGEGLV